MQQRRSDLWECLHVVLPRFLRVCIKKSGVTVDDVLLKLRAANPSVLFLVVPWLPWFVALPGYVSIASLTLAAVVEDGVEIFPMDVASGIPPIMLTKCISHLPGKVLDMCCCPGGKYLMLSDFLQSDATLIGVDVSLQRMHTTKRLVHKYVNTVYANNSEHHPPRMLLFCSDGTCFSREINGELLYDSDIALEEIKQNGYKRKRNKSMRGREEKQLKIAKSVLTSTSSSTSFSESGNQEILKEGEVGKDFKNVFDNYDAVLVDAQCTHDSSYRHLRYLTSCNGSSSDSCVTINASVSESRKYKNITSVQSDDNVYELQRKLLSKAFASLVDGGQLVYSTCSAEIEQNERVVQWLLEQEKDNAELVPVSESWVDGSNSSSNVSENYGPDLSRLVQILTEKPLSYDKLADFFELKHVPGTAYEDTFKALSEEMCHYAASFVKPPGREGEIVGSVYFGMWAGTSGLFLSRLRKKKKYKASSDNP